MSVVYPRLMRYKFPNANNAGDSVLAVVGIMGYVKGF